MLILILIILLFSFCYLKNNKKPPNVIQETNGSMCSHPDYSNFNIIFTTYNYKRQDMINDVVKYYTDVLKFPKRNIFIIDSANKGVGDIVYKENQLIFDQDECNVVDKNSTSFELCSLKKLISDNNIMKALSSRPYTLKITCKYKLPDLCLEMKKAILENPLYIVQDEHNNDWGWQNTEIFGVKTSMLKSLIEKLSEDGDNTHNNGLEQRMGKVINGKDYYRMSPLINKAEYKRAHGDHLKYL
tara:strand:+ start:99 stop:827 length:729 start_codon:yes stop_codon:yes gene_type:complete